MRRGVLLDVGAVGALGGLAFGLFLGHRLDGVGHFLAGTGGTLLLLAGLGFVDPRPRGARVLAVTLLSVAIGAVIEASVFRLAIFDPVDFCNQSLGAVLAGACVLARPLPRRTVAGLLAFAALYVVLGFVLAFA